MLLLPTGMVTMLLMGMLSLTMLLMGRLTMLFTSSLIVVSPCWSTALSLDGIDDGDENNYADNDDDDDGDGDDDEDDDDDDGDDVVHLRREVLTVVEDGRDDSVRPLSNVIITIIATIAINIMDMVVIAIVI